MADVQKCTDLYRIILNEAADFYESSPVTRKQFALKEYLGSRGYTVAHMCDAGLLVYGEDIPVPFDAFAGCVVFVVRMGGEVELHGVKINA